MGLNVYLIKHTCKYVLNFLDTQKRLPTQKHPDVQKLLYVQKLSECTNTFQRCFHDHVELVNLKVVHFRYKPKRT